MKGIAFLLLPGDNDGVLPIHEAASGNQLKCLQFLLKKGAKRTATDKKGQTPLHKANTLCFLTTQTLTKLILFAVIRPHIKELFFAFTGSWIKKKILTRLIVSGKNHERIFLYEFLLSFFFFAADIFVSQLLSSPSF